MTKEELKLLIQSNPCYAVQAIGMYYEDKRNFDPSRKWKEKFFTKIILGMSLKRIQIDALYVGIGKGYFADAGVDIKTLKVYKDNLMRQQ